MKKKVLLTSAEGLWQHMHLGVQELVVILIIVIVLFGGSRLAGIGKALGTSMREFKEEVNRNEGDDEKKDISKDEKSEK